MNYELAYVFEDFLNVSLGYLDCNSPIRSCVTQLFSRPIIELTSNVFKHFIDNMAYITALFNILPHKPIGVFIKSPLP